VDEPIVLRSYRLAFEVERRLHRIDRFRIPLPYGVPLRGIGYGTAILLVLLVAARVPVVGVLISLIPWPVRLMFVPIAGAGALCRIDCDGRPAHEALLHRARAAIRPSSVVAFERASEPQVVRLASVAVAPDERDPTYRRGFIRGKGAVMFRRPASATLRGRRIDVRPAGDRAIARAPVTELLPGQRLQIR
jgi:hypothetical protein